MVLGGTSGMGWALAQHYLQQGAEVAVCGRDLRRLPVAPLPPRLHAFELDIADPGALALALDSFAAPGLDLLIVTAGQYFHTRHQALDEAATLRLIATNVSGLQLAFEGAAPVMLRQRAGQLVAVASMAGLLHDYPGASLYSATKRSVLSLCDTWRAALAPFGVAVTAIVPGYVDTDKLRALNGGDARHKPFLMSEAQAVARIVHAIEQRRAVAIFPWQMHWLVALLNHLPKALLRLRR